MTKNKSKFINKRNEWIIFFLFSVISFTSAGFLGMHYLYPPTIPTYIDTTNSATGVFVSGDYAYVADRKSGLAIIDVSDPLNPSPPSYIVTTDAATDVFVAGKYAYVTVGFSGLAIIDVSDPLNPVAPNYIDTAGYAQSVFVSGDYAYIAEYENGLAIIDVSDPLNPLGPMYVDTIGEAIEVYISNNFAYVVNMRNRLTRINVSDPSNPGSPSYINSTGVATSVFVSGDYAYVVGSERFEKLYPEYLLVTYSHFLEIIDISDPLNQEPQSYLTNISGYAQGVFVSGNYAYIAEDRGGLAIINVSDPLKPGIPSYLNTAGSAQDVFVLGDYVYVAERSKGLGIISLSNIFDKIALFNFIPLMILIGIVYLVINSFLFAILAVKKKSDAFIAIVVTFGIIGFIYFRNYLEYVGF